MSNRTTPTHPGHRPGHHPGHRERHVRGRTGALLRIVASAALVLLALLAGGGTAHAHAGLLESEPAAGARLEAPPAVLRLVFNEDVDVLATTRLSSGTRSVPYQVSVDGGLVEIRPESTLDEGRWSLAWQIVSADGHLVGGVIPFTVGDEPTTGAGTEPATSDPAGTETIADGTRDGYGTLDRLLELLGWVALIVALGAHLADRTAVGRTTALAALTFPLLRLVDAYDRFADGALRIGETRATIAATGAAAVLLIAWSARTPRVRHALLAAGVLLWSAQAFLSGHPNVLDPRWLHAGVHAVHLAGALAWSAAVTAILLDERVAGRASRLATVAVAALIPAAGILGASFLVGNERGDWETTLLVKTALVLGALALGLLNHRAVRAGGTRLRRRTTLELSLIAAVAVLTATLTTHVPSRVAETDGRTESPVPPAATAPGTGNPAGEDGGPVGGTTTLTFENGETGDVLLETASDGRTTIHLVLKDTAGVPFTAEQAGYELENTEEGIGGIAGDLPVSGGMHMGETTLPTGGAWRITVHATYDTFTTITATAEIVTAGE